MATIVVPRRFRGPSTSGNGGYTAGLLAQCLVSDVATAAGGPVTVRLYSPPPLDTELRVDLADGVATARHGDVVVAEARRAEVVPEPVPAVPYEVAVKAAATYAGFGKHPFPECVVCGPARQPGDGMQLFPGLVATGRTACPWVPHPSLGGASAGAEPAPGELVPSELVWAALDCPGGWTADLEGRPMVLGTITVQIDEPPWVGEPCVVTGAMRVSAGRRTDTSTSLYGRDGRPLAHASAVWVAIDAAAFDRIFAPTG